MIYPFMTTPTMGARITAHGAGMMQHSISIMKANPDGALGVARQTFAAMQQTQPQTLGAMQ